MTSAAAILMALAFYGQVIIAVPLQPAQAIAVGQPQTHAAKPDGPAYPLGAVFTIDNDRFDGPIASLETGRLSIQSDPPRTVPLDEVDRIELGSVAPPAVVWIGQDNHDFAQPGPNPGANGIQDVHLRCGGLSSVRTITQVVVAASIGGVPQIWMLEPNNTPFGRLVSERAGGSDTADLYFEPPAADCFDQQFDVTVTFDNNESTKVALRATSHTIAKLNTAGRDDIAIGARLAHETGAQVLLAGDASVHGRFVGLEKEMLLLSAWGAQRLEIPLADVRGCWLGGTQPDERKKFDERAQAGGQSDWVLIMGRDQVAAAVEGNLQGVTDGKLEFVVAGETRKVALDRLLGFVLATHPPRPNPDSLYQVFQLANGDKFSGQLTSVDPQTIGLRTAWNGELKLPRGSVRAITCRNGRATYLSDLEPVAVEETAYFTRHLPYRRDEALDGGPLVLGGTTYRKGLAMHSRSLLTYALDGRYESFQARLGFDDGAPPGGSVACRVLADDRELFAIADLRPDADSIALKLDVAGAKQLVLEVDFGQGQDVGDRVTWAGARVFRPLNAAALQSAATESSP
jgi:hypothetical protein